MLKMKNATDALDSFLGTPWSQLNGVRFSFVFYRPSEFSIPSEKHYGRELKS